ncbi:hypothetical protein [Dyella choica]|uniref:Uncharacterized protein n=1 Tax=Dyella choica TaxID=1927959 RepID=A0A432M545_9GAMM|nr:hypothetical protein [Dyella choica]RUL74559.1 hypothetical protein EKH80_13860 [Dyella choica]
MEAPVGAFARLRLSKHGWLGAEHHSVLKVEDPASHRYGGYLRQHCDGLYHQTEGRLRLGKGVFFGYAQTKQVEAKSEPAAISSGRRGD